jgi:hypothetical protein
MIILLFTMNLLPTMAQDSCTKAAGNAATILDSALILLQSGNTDGATTLITTARDMLATCVPDNDNESHPTAQKLHRIGVDFHGEQSTS